VPTIGQRFRKDLKFPNWRQQGGWGGFRSGNPDGVAVHTTEGNPNSTFEGECRFLRDSRDVSANYVVGKLGQIEEILPPNCIAYHVGEALAGWSNGRVIGIECHHRQGDAWPAAQVEALSWLLRTKLMPKYRIGVARIESHSFVAIPSGRKIDPTNWPRIQFLQWRRTLVSETLVVGAEFVASYNLSGGAWRKNELTPGLPVTGVFEWRGKKRQLFERAGATLEADGVVSWMLAREYAEASAFVRG
jgi:hypothetical protein